MDRIDEYFSRITEALIKTESGLLFEIAGKIMQTKDKNRRVFTAGNGGSAATASHFCNDLIKGCRVHGRIGFKAQCLCDPMPVTTCLANDFGYDDIFSVQLETYGEKGDLLILFSGSGNSPNVIKATEAARKLGMFIIGFGGRDGGKLKGLCDIFMLAPTQSMEELEDLHLTYCHCLVSFIRDEMYDRWDIEIINYPKKSFKYALFDFDGTVSLLREGWREVMIPYFVEEISKAQPNPDYEEINHTVAEFVDLLTGKQTIFQCMKLDEEVQARGGPAVDPYIYKAEYLRRLMDGIKSRHVSLRNGSAKEDFLVPGIIPFLEGLKARGVRLYLASGTDEVDVIAEAKLLGVADYFDGGIFGAKDSIKDCSKELVIRQILEENNINGEDLVSFGDGYVEVQLVKEAGGYAIAAATDETRRKGINAWKRERLLSAKADAVIPDFTGAERLIRFLSGEDNAI